MSVSEKKDKLTECLNEAVRKYGGQKVAKVFRVKQPTVWQWSCGDRENPLTQTLEFLEWLKHKDPQLFYKIAEIYSDFLGEEVANLVRLKRFVEKLYEFYINDFRFDVWERRELEREFKDLVGGVKE